MSALGEALNAFKRSNFRLASALASKALQENLQPTQQYQAAELAAMSFARLDQNADSLAMSRKMLDLKPGDHNILQQIAVLALEIGEHSLAERSINNILTDDASNMAALRLRGDLLQEAGRPDQALECYRLALQQDPAQLETLNHYLFCLHCSEIVTADEILNAHVQWARYHAPAIESTSVQKQSVAAHSTSRIRIAYFSPNFNTAATVRLFHPVLQHHDCRQFEIYLYSNTGIFRQFAELFQSKCHKFTNVSGLSSSQTAKAIADDGIDILIDLAGHARNNILPTLAHRPAAVQLTMLDYWDTTGLTAIDYFVSDELHSPASNQQHFVEQLVKLPVSRLCCQPEANAPAVSPTPAIKNGFISFGSFNRPRKLTDSVLDCWAQILTNVPASKLVLKCQYLENEDFASGLRARFEARGIDAERIILKPRSTYLQLLADYNEIDIALDPFPWNGGLTTLDALHMGVPVVALAGNRVISRQSTAMLTLAGLGELIGADKEAYISIATARAKDIPALQQLRQGIRSKFLNSPLVDSASYTRQLEQLYNDLLAR